MLWRIGIRAVVLERKYIENVAPIGISQCICSIPARSHTFVAIDYEISSTAILLTSADLFKKGCCQLWVKLCVQVPVNRLFKLPQEKSVVR